MSLAKAETPNRNYEGVIILHPDVNEEQQKAFFKKSTETIKSFKGRVNHIDTWGKRRLANPIKKMKLGTYFHLTFESQPECVNELERTMRIDDRVLRFSHMKLDERESLANHVEKFKNALNSYEEALSMDPDNSTLLFYKANTYLESKKYTKANSTYYEALRNNPSVQEKIDILKAIKKVK